MTIRFARRTGVMPPVPLETKHHPSAVDLLLIKRLIAETSKQNLLQFLQHEFVNISKSYAERLIGNDLIMKVIFCSMLRINITNFSEKTCKCWLKLLQKIVGNNYYKIIIIKKITLWTHYPFWHLYGSTSCLLHFMNANWGYCLYICGHGSYGMLFMVMEYI